MIHVFDPVCGPFIVHIRHTAVVGQVPDIDLEFLAGLFPVDPVTDAQIGNEDIITPFGERQVFIDLSVPVSLEASRLTAPGSGFKFFKNLGDLFKLEPPLLLRSLILFVDGPREVKQVSE